MVRNIVFHLGDPKTGTTAIQEALATQNWLCEQKSVLYPARINHIPLAKTLFDPEEYSNKDEKFRRVARELSVSNADYGVISAELFERVDPIELKKAIETYFPHHAQNVRLISYVRPHADRLISAYAERQKQGFFLGTLEDLFQKSSERSRFIYYPRFTRWRDVFGDQFTLRPMIRSELKEGDVVHDFLDYLLEGAPFKMIADRGSNESLSLEDLAMLREFHRLLRGKSEFNKPRTAVGWNFARMLTLSPRPDGTRPRIHKSLMVDVIAAFEEDAERLDRDFFEGRNPMKSALHSAQEKAVDEPQSIKAKDHFDPDQLRLIRAWAKLAADMIEMKPIGLQKHLHRQQVLNLIEEKDANDKVAGKIGARIKNRLFRTYYKMRQSFRTRET